MMTPVTWKPPDPSLMLPPNTVHIWRATVPAEHPACAYYRCLLSPAEQHRAARYYNPLTATQFIISRGILRQLLGQYLHMPPHCIPLHVGSFGKPYLARQPSDQDIRFNVAHSHAMVLYAFTRGRRVGIDLEATRGIRDPLHLASHYCTPHEQRELSALPPTQRADVFIACWTRKEAYVKAIGIGLTQSLNKLEVGLPPTVAPSLRVRHSESPVAVAWTLHTFTPGSGYHATLAVEGPSWHSTYYQYLEHAALERGS
jgi:4'-phosphopantetheinyl transferase